MTSRCGLFLALLIFASPNNLFKYLQRRYESGLIRELNEVLRLKGRAVRAGENINFLSKCLTWYVTPVWIRRRVRVTRPKAPTGIERAFIKDEINKERDILNSSRRKYRELLSKVGKALSFFDWIRFCKFVNRTEERQRSHLRRKKTDEFERLNKEQNGDQRGQHKTIVNLSSVELTDVEKDVLCRGLKFGVPPRLRKEQILAEFELAWQQIPKGTLSKEDEMECKARLSGTAHRYANSKIDRTGFRLNREHMTAIGQLKKNKNIVIIRQDKGNGTVLMDKSDYIEKMETILKDEAKFELIGNAEEHDRTLQLERALQAFLLRAEKQGHISREVYERVRPVGSTRPRLYGVAKVHKLGTPLRPILSMIKAPQHELAKWLAEVLKPVLAKYSSHLLKDTFEFCEHIEQFSEENDCSEVFMCSFDIVSLFTNVPLKEAIQICMDTLYRDDDVPTPGLPEKLLEKMLLKTTTEVEFSFEGKMFKQIDGVAMGSPLGPILANIFVGFLEKRIPKENMPLLYDRFVDDTFSIFNNQSEVDPFLVTLNSLHPNLKFTVEKEVDKSLPFMDVKAMKRNGKLIRTVYRKPTFTGLYTRWDSFCATKYKTNLVKSLVHRSVKICSKEMLDDELQILTDIFGQNGYPLGLVQKIMRSTVESAAQQPGRQNDDERTMIFMRLPWIGETSRKFQKEIEGIISKACPTTKPNISFTTQHAFNTVYKDVLPMTSRSFLIYQYGCCCGQQYIGKTTQLLGERIKQHIPSKIIDREADKKMKVEKNDSAVTKHLKENAECVPLCKPESRFKILAEARSNSHLDVLETIFIKKLLPVLCAQKEFTRQLQLYS